VRRRYVCPRQRIRLIRPLVLVPDWVARLLDQSRGSQPAGSRWRSDDADCPAVALQQPDKLMNLASWWCGAHNEIQHGLWLGRRHAGAYQSGLSDRQLAGD